MSVQAVAKSFGGMVDRHRFLSRIGVATVGLLGLAGLAPSRAHAIWYGHGCNLCGAPSSCGPLLNCAWCWQGECHNDGGFYRFHTCCEGYAGSNCSNHCPAYCSYYFGSYICHG